MNTKNVKKKATSAKKSLENFKNEVASELGVNLKNSKKGSVTAKEAGSVGGEMVKKMVKKAEDSMKN